MDVEEQDQNIVVQVARKFNNVDFDLSKLKKMIRAVCHRFGFARATVSIAIVDDNEIRKINNKFLSRNCSTDCLSFDLSNDDAEADKLFELVVNAENAVREGKLRGHSGEVELALYVIHSLLHNFGFDDSQQSQAKKMHDTEDEILQEFGYGPVYNSNSKS